MSKLKLVSFPTTDNLILPGLLYEPSKSTDTAVIYLHGNGSSSIFYKSNLMNTIAKELNDSNVAFFPFNNRGAHIMKSLTRVGEADEEKVMMGMTYELIKDCVYDIDGAIEFLKIQGYKKIYVMGHSTGANKIVVYNYYKQKKDLAGYILLAGGDDTGLYYESMGKKKFNETLKRSREKVSNEKGIKLVPKYLSPYFPLSWQSMYDTINPEGDYNIFPFNDYLNNLKLSKKELFSEYKSIQKQTLVVYGSEDEFCYGKVEECVEILKQKTSEPKKFRFEIIAGSDHSFTGKEKELSGVITRWLTKGV